MARRSPPRRPRKPAAQTKVTMRLAPELAERLVLCARKRRQSIGDLVTPALEQTLDGFYVVDRPPGRQAGLGVLASMSEQAAELERAS